MHPRSFLYALLAAPALTVLFAQPPSSEPPEAVPLVVAVDTSRSLRGEELQGSVSAVRRALAGLAPSAPASLLAFDDQPRWVRPSGGTVAEVLSALPELSPAGRYTVLHDALFVAARALDRGGVILLLTDGRDENSATTIEDVAHRCDAQNVRVVAAGAGGRLEERSLRRLALLTNGSYLGPVATADPQILAREIQQARRAVQTDLPGRTTQPGAAASTPEVAEAVTPRLSAAAPSTGSPVSGTTALSRSLLLLAAVVFLIALPAALWVWMKRGRPERTDFCPRCGSELDPVSAACARCEGLELQDRLRDRAVAVSSETAEIEVDPQILGTTAGVSLEERLEKTRVLAQQTVLLVREPGEPARSLSLPDEKAFGVGRDPASNTLVIPDPALSAQHFKIVPENGKHYIVDLGSTNGTYVNQSRVTARSLASGDLIQAGQIEFEFRVYQAPSF